MEAANEVAIVVILVIAVAWCFGMRCTPYVVGDGRRAWGQQGCRVAPDMRIMKYHWFRKDRHHENGTLAYSPGFRAGKPWPRFYSTRGPTNAH